jgi:hypothetical protein
VLKVLRIGVGIVGALLMAIGLLLLIAGGALVWPGIQLVVVGSVGVVIALFERLRYAPQRSTMGELRPTDERFIDPTTGQRTRVWIDPQSGERMYRPEE